MAGSRTVLRLLGIALPLGAVTAIALLVRERSGSPQTGETVLLADVLNETGDSGLDRGLASAAAVGLQQSRHLRVYPRSRLPVIYGLMRLEEPDPGLTWELAREVAERDGVRFVLGLTVARDGDGYLVRARLADLAGGREPPRIEARAALRDGVIGALDEVLAGARRALGESRRDVARARAPLPQVTTASLEALRSYDDASRAWTRGDYTVARELWLRAIDLDTGFAMAFSALGSAAYYARFRADGERWFAAALERTDRLTEWERLRVLQQQAAFRGDADSAVVIGGLVARRFPSVYSWYDYGSSLMRAGRSREAIDALTRAVAFDSSYVNAWINLATTNVRLGALDHAIRHYQRAAALDSLVLYRGNINHEYGRTLVELGRKVEAEAAYRRMAASPRLTDRALGLRSLGWLAFYDGRLYEALGAFQQAMEATRQGGSPMSEGRNALLLAGVYRAMNRMGDANEAVSRALSLSGAPAFTPDMLGVLLYACLQYQRPRDAEAVAALLEARVDSQNPVDLGAAALAAGARFLGRQQYDSALAHLRRAEAFPIRMQRLMLMAAAFDGVGERDSVRATLEAVLAVRGFGLEGQDDWLRAPLLLGDVLLQAGDTAGAAARYRALLERWRQAPPDTPDLVSARARLAGLTRTTR